MSEGIVDELFSDVSENPPVDNLEALSVLVKEFRSIERDIEAAEEILKLKRKALEEVSRVKIPTILNTTGLSEIRLSTGEKIKIQDKVQASITEGNSTLAYRNMVNAQGGGDDAEAVIDSLFKSQVIIGDASDKVLNVLLDNDIDYETKRSIHHATLSKYCKERLAMGLQIPEGISVFQYQETKISN